MKKQTAICIRATQNGYNVSPIGRGEGLTEWSFESLGALIKKLPDIMDVPYEKQPASNRERD